LPPLPFTKEESGTLRALVVPIIPLRKDRKLSVLSSMISFFPNARFRQKLLLPDFCPLMNFLGPT
jgi:hypothetical protein